jgi:hypothetical protein
MFSYVAYGLSIHSALPLPELLAGGAAADVTIRPGRVALPPQASPDKSSYVAAPEEIYLYWPRVGSFQIREGREIVVDAARGAAAGLVRLNLLGVGLAVLLHQRGQLVLHGSAVAIGAGAAVFLGASGAGKSTTAAALVARGHRLLSDDVVALTQAPEQPWVQPAFPQIKLWPEAAQALGKHPAALDELHPLIEKRADRPVDDFGREPTVLLRIYVLDHEERQAVLPLRASAGLAELVRHSYCAGLLGYGGAGGHFQQCAALVRQVRVQRLVRPRDLGALASLAELVEQDLSDEQSS